MVTERFISVLGRLQKRACNSTPEAAPPLSREPYAVHQWCSSPPASCCNTAKKNLEIQSYQGPMCTATVQTAWAIRALLVWASFAQENKYAVLAHLGIDGCFGWRDLSQPSSPVGASSCSLFSSSSTDHCFLSLP